MQAIVLFLRLSLRLDGLQRLSPPLATKSCKTSTLLRQRLTKTRPLTGGTGQTLSTFSLARRASPLTPGK